MSVSWGKAPVPQDSTTTTPWLDYCNMACLELPLMSVQKPERVERMHLWGHFPAQPVLTKNNLLAKFMPSLPASLLHKLCRLPGLFFSFPWAQIKGVAPNNLEPRYLKDRFSLNGPASSFASGLGCLFSAGTPREDWCVGTRDGALFWVAPRSLNLLLYPRGYTCTSFSLKFLILNFFECFIPRGSFRG